jgi:mono/diheme cytochrome c family protein
MNANRTAVLTIVTLLTGSLTAVSALAADVEQGKKLYTERCGGCHDTKVHTRPNRIIHTYEDLVNRVRFCDNAAKAGLTDDQILDVSEYLNDTFYKFLKVKDND